MAQGACEVGRGVFRKRDAHVIFTVCMCGTVRIGPAFCIVKRLTIMFQGRADLPASDVNDVNDLRLVADNPVAKTAKRTACHKCF